MTCLNSICILSSLVVNLDWEMFRLDFKNAFLYDNVHLYGAPPGHVAQRQNTVCKFIFIYIHFHLWNQAESLALFEKFSTVITCIDFQHCHYYHYVFVQHITSNIVPIVIYVD